MFKDVVKGLARNTSIMMFQQVVTWGSTFVIMMMLPRYLGPIEYGWVFLAGSVTAIFGMLVSYGGSYLVAKKVARDPDGTGQIMVDSIAFRFLFALLSIVAIVGFTFVAGYSAELRLLIFIYAIGLMWESGGTVLYACYQGRELMKYTSVSAIVERLLQVIVIVATVHAKANVFVISIFGLAANFVAFAVLLGFSRRIVLSVPRIQWQSVRKELREGLPYFLFALFGTVYYRIDSLMLSRMTPELVVGWYGAAYRLFEILNFPYILTIALFPVLARLWKTEEQMQRRTMLKSLELVILVAIPVTVGVIVYAHRIVSLFYGLPAYGPTVVLLQILVGGIILLYVNMVISTTLIAMDRQTGMMILSLVSIPLNVILNYFMIPYCQVHYNDGAIGAAIATGLTELVVMITVLNMLPEGILSTFRFSILAKGALAGFFMAAILLILDSTTLLWPVSLVIGSSCYITALLLMRILEPAEEAFLKELVMTRILRGFKQFTKS